MKQFRFSLASLIICIASSVVVFAQSQERIIKLEKLPNEPIQIMKLKVSGKEASFNQPFNAQEDDWFRDLSVTVKNVSNQTIYSIEIELTFYSNDSNLFPSRDRLFYGCIPLTNKQVELENVPSRLLNQTKA